MILGKKFILGTSGILVLGLLIAGCGSSSTSSSSPTPAAKKTDVATSAPATPTTSATSTTSKTAPYTKKITIMAAGLEKLTLLPLKLTEALGYYKDEGLTVELLNSAAGQNAEVSLLAGEIQGVGGFYDHTIDMQAKGKNLKSVLQLIGVPGARLMVSEKAKDKIKSIQDLKGVTIGVTGLGSSTDFLANFLVVKGGHLTKDYTPVPVGSGTTLIAAMQAGKIDLAVSTEPTVSLLISKHLATSLVDMNSVDGTKAALSGLYPASSLYMTSDFVEKNPDAVQHLANAIVKSLKYIQTHTPEEIADKLPVEYLAGDRALYLTALKASLPMYTVDGQMPTEGPGKVLEVLTAFNPKLKDANIKLDQTFTNEFVKNAK